MPVKDNLNHIKSGLPAGVELVAVSKTHSAEKILEAYEIGHRIFGENRIQELKEKKEALPEDIQWHFIGSLQTNKVKYIAPYISLIHSGDSARLLQTIQKEAVKNSRSIDVLLEVHIAEEESKQGWHEDELIAYLRSGGHRELPNVGIRGVMGMATFTDDNAQIRREFKNLKEIFDKLKTEFFSSNDRFNIISMGMSGDYGIAIECGSNMVRVGSSIFGERYYK
ncbi:MAG: YggS family pyridoxal phosphate-dependent enzyme [Rikenellaceae bacterium]|nr:YggS family pyridoxal phosphate-dependent enzyme [Rikenellaceae bacterium]